VAVDAKLSNQADEFFAWVFHWELTKAEVRRAVVFIGMCLAAALLFLGLFYVWTRMQQVQVGYEISSLEAKNRDLKNRKHELMLEIASQQSPGELEKKARKQGLTFPAMGKIVHVP
jgi:cell division protein FtsL